MSYLPVILGLVTAFGWGTSDYLSRSQSEKFGHYNTAVYMHLMNVFLLLLLVPVLAPPLSVTPLAAVVLVVGGGLNFAALVYLYRAFHKGVVSAVAPVAYTYPAVTTVFSVLLLGAVLAPIRAASIASIILGVVLISTRFSELRGYLKGGGLPSVTKGVGSAAAASFCFGIVYVGVGYVTPAVGYFVPVLLLRVVGTLVAFPTAVALKEKILSPRKTLSLTIFAMGVLETLGFLAFSYGLSLGVDSIPVVAALSGTGGAVAASYAMVLLKERLETNQVLGVVLSIAGVFALLYLEG